MMDNLKKALAFGLAVACGLGLAWFFYEALQPSVALVVEPLLAKEALGHKRAASLAAQQRPPQAARASAQPASVARPASPLSSGATTSAATPAASAGQSAGFRTRLPPDAEAAGWGLWQWLLLGVGLAGAGGVVGWGGYEARQRLAPPVPTARLLEELLILPQHLTILKRSLSPRQIKRFNSKARVQHRRLTKLAQDNPNFAFPVEGQLLAFQALLLLEEDREGLQRLLYASQNEFITRIERAYATRADLATARRQALNNGVIVAAIKNEKAAITKKVDGLEREALTAGLKLKSFVEFSPRKRHRLLVQLHDMNTGLLA